MTLLVLISRGLLRFEILILLIATIFSTEYVEYSAQILERLAPEGTNLLEIAYGLVIFLATLICSIVRAFTGKSVRSKAQSNIFLTVLIAAAIVTLTYQYLNSARGPILVTEIVTPYIGYLLTLLICLGAGYILADFFIQIFRKD